MATNTSVQGSVTLRKLRSGSTVAVSIWTSQQLFQTYEAGNVSNVGPTWSTANPVKCQVIVNGTALNTGVQWYINNNEVTGIEGGGFDVADGELTIKRNLVDLLKYQNGTLKAVFTLDGASMTKTADITIMQVTGSQYNVILSANNGGVVDADTTCTITASVILGTKTLDETTTPKASELFYTWSSADNDQTVSSQSGKGKKTCNVTAAMVDGVELYFCSVKASDAVDVLDTGAIAITDNSDPYRLKATITDANTTAGHDNQTLYDVPEAVTSVKVKFSVVKSDDTAAPASVTNGATWLIKKYHSDTMNLITGSSGTATSTGGSTVGDASSKSATDTITVYDCDYLSSEKPAGVTASTHNTNVIVQADCTLS